LAFIYRTNAQSRLIEEACVQNNVPYVVFGSFTSFYNRQEVKDCLCFLRWLNNGRDRVAMLRTIETPKRGLGDTAVKEFEEYCALVEQFWDDEHPGEIKPDALEVLFYLSGDYSWCTIPNPQFPPPEASFSSRPLKLFREFSADMLTLRTFAEQRTVAQTLQSVLDQFKLKPHFNKISKSKDEFQERLANVDELLKAAIRYEKDGACLDKKKPTASDSNENAQSPLGTFLDDISMVTEQADTSADSSGEDRFVASLMTIHSSKGMEFDTVFFVGVEDGTIPSTQVCCKRFYLL
jgi:DNA helicase II / ATP-dependent DNA helicase PcrA